MRELKYKFVSSKFKLYLIMALISILGLSAIINLILFLVNDSDLIYLLLCSICLIFIILTVVVCSKLIYIVEIYIDRFVFKPIFNKKEQTLLLSNITNVYTMTLTREGTFYILEIKGIKNLLKYDYPFKFDYNIRTEEIVKSFWSGPIKKL